MNATYLLPIKRANRGSDDLAAYLAEVASLMPVLVVDGSSGDYFRELAERLPPGVRHVPVDRNIKALNGKVAGVLTGLPFVDTPHVVIADDDVRYNKADLLLVDKLLEEVDIVRVQNIFDPMPWHALLDTGRTLIARALGGDWPGTLGVRTETLRAAGGYCGDVLFENLELARTIEAHGGKALIAWHCFVARRPPTVRRYLEQRVRQAYDEFARPRFLVAELALAPVVSLLAARLGARSLIVVALCAVFVAERGRRKGGGTARFPMAASFLAPIWVAERALTIWIALGMRVFFGGVRYGDVRIRESAHSVQCLREMTS